MVEFTDLEKVFLYRDIILDYIFKKYKIESYFDYIDYDVFKRVSLEQSSFTYFGSFKDYWIFLFFNPDLKIEEFGLLNNINENEFIENKLEYIYKNILGKNFYTNEQINKVFDSYHEYKNKKLLLPKIYASKTIKTAIIDYLKKLIIGRN